MMEVVVDVFLKILPNFVTLKTSGKTFATMCFHCKGINKNITC